MFLMVKVKHLTSQKDIQFQFNRVMKIVKIVEKIDGNKSSQNEKVLHLKLK